MLAFLVGAVAGAAAALLYAPATGRETREFLGEKAREGRERATEAAARDARPSIAGATRGDGHRTGRRHQQASIITIIHREGGERRRIFWVSSPSPRSRCHRTRRRGRRGDQAGGGRRILDQLEVDPSRCSII